MLYPSRSTGPFVAISLFLSRSLYLSLSLSLSLSPHHSFVSFHVGNNARFNAKSIDDERAFIRFIRFAKIIQNRFFDDEGVEIRWFVGVVIIDCRYIVDILIYFWVRNIV